MHPLITNSITPLSSHIKNCLSSLSILHPLANNLIISTTINNHVLGKITTAHPSSHINSIPFSLLYFVSFQKIMRDDQSLILTLLSNHQLEYLMSLIFYLYIKKIPPKHLCKFKIMILC